MKENSPIPRYAYDLDKLSFVKHNDGGWVRFKDYIDEIKKLKAELDEIKNKKEAP